MGLALVTAANRTGFAVVLQGLIVESSSDNPRRTKKVRQHHALVCRLCASGLARVHDQLAGKVLCQVACAFSNNAHAIVCVTSHAMLQNAENCFNP